MHVAIEGMDGVGKTSQAMALSKRLKGQFISKSFHEMNDVSGKYDSFVTIESYSDGEQPGIYGMRQNYFWSKVQDEIVITDRFYISNYWSRAKELAIAYFKQIIYYWGVPDLMILLYAEPPILYKRICERSPNDLYKPQMAKEAYRLMFDFARKMGSTVMVLDNSNLSFEETTDIIELAVRKGISYCEKQFDHICYLIKPMEETLENETGIFTCVGNELISCKNYGEIIRIPEGITGIRDHAFETCLGKLQIFLPRTMKDISCFAFSKTQVASFDVAIQNESFVARDGILYNKSGSALVRCPNRVTNILTLNVENIKSCAFLGCDELKSIVFQSSLRKIGYAAFGMCKKLESIRIESKMISFFAPGCIRGCHNLKELFIQSEKYKVKNCCVVEDECNILFGRFGENESVFDEHISYIYPYAFEGKLETAHLQLSAKKIGAFAFQDSIIGELTFSDGIEDIGEKSFANVQIEKVLFNNSPDFMIPDIWKNSFEESVILLIPQSALSQVVDNRDWRELNVYARIGIGTRGLSCGNACLHYLSEKDHFEYPILDSRNGVWIFEIAKQLSYNKHWNIAIYYYDSKLMADFVGGKLTHSFYPITIMDDFVISGGQVCERNIDVIELKELVARSHTVILCMNSKILFRDEKLKNHSHYVIAKSVDDKGIFIISPGSKEFYFIYLTDELLLKAWKSNGQWALVVSCL